MTFTRLDNRREAFTVHQLSPKRESRRVPPARNTRDCCMRSPYTTFHRFQSSAYQPNTHVFQVSHQDVVMLFCPSFTQSERFLHTDQLIARLQVVVMTNFKRMLSGNEDVIVFKSDAVIWWAAIFRTNGGTRRVHKMTLEKPKRTLWVVHGRGPQPQFHVKTPLSLHQEGKSEHGARGGGEVVSSGRGVRRRERDTRKTHDTQHNTQPHNTTHPHNTTKHTQDAHTHKKMVQVELGLSRIALSRNWPG